MSAKTSTMFTKPTETSASTKRHRKAAVACIACKVRKIRCSGSAPCETCVSLDTKCIIDETLDGRRKVALNRRLEELFHYRWILEALLICLRTCRGRRLVAILELLFNESPLPVLAAALCSLLAECPIPMGQDKEIADLQQNLASYVQENEPMVSCMPDSGPNDLTPKDYGPPSSKSVMLPPNPSGSALGLEQNPSNQSSYQPMDSSPSFPFKRRADFNGEFTAFPGNLAADLASVADDVGLDVIVECLKGACVEIPQPDLFNGYLAHFSRYVDGADGTNGQVTSLEGDRKRSSPEYPCDSELERNAPKSKKRPLSVIMIPPSHIPFTELPTATVVPSSATSSRRHSITSSAVCSSRTEHSPLAEYTFNAPKEAAWTGRPVGHYMAVPQIELNGHPMACAITSYMDLARTMLTQGKSIQEIFGPERAVVDLLFRKRRQSDSHSVCNFAAELCAGIKDLDMSAKLGMTFMYTYLLRWMILPSSDNYNKVPEIYRPTLMQTGVPHCAIIEFCPFPVLRDSLCRRYRDFLAALANTISCNWPYALETCIEHDHKTGHVMLTDDFARHCLNASHWTVQPVMFDTFPECRGLIRTGV